MDTITINITIPKPMKKAVDEQIKSGLYTSFSEFVRNAVRHLLTSRQSIPYGPPFSPEAEKEILAAEKEALAEKNPIIIKNPKELKKFFDNL